MFVVRDLSPADAGWIFEACQDAEIQRWTLVPRPYTQQHAEDFAAHGAGEKRVWVVERMADRRSIGMISVHTVTDGVADIGYWIAPWGRHVGAGSTAVRLVCEEIATWDDVASITARIATTNVASQATVRRAGFALDPLGPVATCPDGDCQVEALTFRYVVV